MGSVCGAAWQDASCASPGRRSIFTNRSAQYESALMTSPLALVESACHTPNFAKAVKE